MEPPAQIISSATLRTCSSKTVEDVRGWGGVGVGEGKRKERRIICGRKKNFFQMRSDS